MTGGDVENSVLPCGQIVGMIKVITSIADIVEGVMNNVAGVKQRLDSELSFS